MSISEGTVIQTAALSPLEADASVMSVPARSGRSDALKNALIVSGWALPVLDLLALSLAFVAAALLTHDPRSSAVLAAFPVLGVLLLAGRGAYSARLRLIVLDSLGNAAGSISVAAMGALSLTVLLGSRQMGETLLFRAWLLGLMFVGTSRLAFILWQQRLRSRGTTARRTLIIGAGEVGARIGRRLEQTPAYGLRPIGYVDDDPPSEATVGGRPVHVLGPVNDLLGLVERTGAEHVILAFSGTSDGNVLPLLRRCAAQGVGVSLVPRLFDVINTRLACEPVGGLPIATLRSTNPLGPTFRVKHALDRIAAVMLIVLLAPLLALIAGLVKRDSPGPVLFRQRRIGRDNHPFDVLKFRTMTLEGREPEFVPVRGLAPGGVEGADRRTRVGRWLRRTSLDELPQLINVARGEMSLVGPRPERPEYAALFAADMVRYVDRHRVRAGITGLSQVHGLRGQSPIADRVELDNYYIENWSLGLDLKILLMTLLAVVRAAE